MIKDSGERREFNSGAVRDIQTGKGRCDLLPLREVAELMGTMTGEDQVLMDINFFMQSRDVDFLLQAIRDFALEDMLAHSIINAILEVAVHYEEGCGKYGERNWQKGIPLHCYIDSGVRHYLKFRRGDDDERHDRAFIWNMLGAVWTYRNCPDMDDLPGAGEDILPTRGEGQTGADVRLVSIPPVVTPQDVRNYLNGTGNYATTGMAAELDRSKMIYD